MFRGSNQAKVDDKGRLKIPSGFKTLLDAANVTQFYITSIDGKNAQLWPLPEWEKREALLAGHGDEEAIEKYLNLTSYYGQQVEMDSQSRVVLPQKLRDGGKLNAEVLVLGKLTYLEVQNEKQADESLPLNSMTPDDRKVLSAFTKGNS